MPTRSQQGDIAETEFLARAPPKRGSRSAAPYGNSCRYDAILDNGIDCCRVQVKSTSYQVRKGVYFVRFGRSLGHAYCEQKRSLRCRAQCWRQAAGHRLSDKRFPIAQEGGIHLLVKLNRHFVPVQHVHATRDNSDRPTLFFRN